MGADGFISGKPHPRWIYLLSMSSKVDALTGCSPKRALLAGTLADEPPGGLCLQPMVPGSPTVTVALAKKPASYSETCPAGHGATAARGRCNLSIIQRSEWLNWTLNAPSGSKTASGGRQTQARLSFQKSPCWKGKLLLAVAC